MTVDECEQLRGQIIHGYSTVYPVRLRVIQAMFFNVTRRIRLYRLQKLSKGLNTSDD